MHEYIHTCIDNRHVRNLKVPLNRGKEDGRESNESVAPGHVIAVNSSAHCSKFYLICSLSLSMREDKALYGWEWVRTQVVILSRLWLLRSDWRYRLSAH
jgi:hypothetical protein